MDPRLTNMRTFSISVPGIERPLPVETEVLPGLLSTLSVVPERGALNYTETHLGELLGESSPLVHPDLGKGRYFTRMARIYAERNKGPSPIWSSVAIGSMLGAVGATKLYQYLDDFSKTSGGLAALAIVAFMMMAVGSCVAAMEPRKDGVGKESYSYLDAFGGGKSHIKWKEYWRMMLVEDCDSNKLRLASRRAKEFGFRMRYLRRPTLATKDDGTQLTGNDIWQYMMYNSDRGFAAITSLLWAAEAARRAVGKPLRDKIGASTVNAEYFLKLAEALSGEAPTKLSLSEPYSQPFADLIGGAAYYVGLANKLPIHTASLSALLARYYYERGNNNNASLMTTAMHYVLRGRWRSAFGVHLSAAKRNSIWNRQPEKATLSAMHRLVIARLMHERMIYDYMREIGLGAYTYASSAAVAFDELAHDIPEASEQLGVLKSGAESIMQVMSDNGPFREYR